MGTSEPGMCCQKELSGLVTFSLTRCRAWSRILTLPAGQQVVEFNMQVHFQAMNFQKAVNPSLPTFSPVQQPELCDCSGRQSCTHWCRFLQQMSQMTSKQGNSCADPLTNTLGIKVLDTCCTKHFFKQWLLVPSFLAASKTFRFFKNIKSWTMCW